MSVTFLFMKDIIRYIVDFETPVNNNNMECCIVFFKINLYVIGTCYLCISFFLCGMVFYDMFVNIKNYIFLVTNSGVLLERLIYSVSIFQSKLTVGVKMSSQRYIVKVFYFSLTSDITFN